MAIIGIDLGTTNSLVAAWTAQGPRLIENALGDTLTPSAVSFDADGGAIVGRAALDRLISHPDRSVAGFKRMMGSARLVDIAGKSLRPEDLSALVLRALREDAETALGEAVTEAVISVPAYFSDPQRKATLDAARIAGLKVERLVNEPTAAALAHSLEKQDGLFLILDLGGGTFDVSLLHKLDGMIEIKASAGDVMLGGDDFSKLIAGEIARRAGIPLSDLPPQAQARLRRAADDVKRILSDQHVAPYAFDLPDAPVAGEITRDAFETLAEPLMRRLRAPIEQAISDSRIAPGQIGQIVLVGGATRMPMIRAFVAKLFGRFPLLDPRPDHVIALGAATQMGLKARDAALDDVVMVDVCPFTLGIASFDARVGRTIFSPIIERNSVVPVSRNGLYQTLLDDQEHITVKVLQGEDIRPERNILLGTIDIAVPKGPAGRESVDVRFTFDINGVLIAEVTSLSTKERRREVFRNQSNLGEAEIDARMEALKEIRKPPRERVVNQALIARAERLFAQSRGETRDAILQAIGEFQRAIDNPHLSDAELTRIRKEMGLILDRFDKDVFA